MKLCVREQLRIRILWSRVGTLLLPTLRFAWDPRSLVYSEEDAEPVRNRAAPCALFVQFHGQPACSHPTERLMNGIIYLVGLVVVVMAVLSLIGIH